MRWALSLLLAGSLACAPDAPSLPTNGLASVAASAMLREALSLPHPNGVRVLPAVPATSAWDSLYTAEWKTLIDAPIAAAGDAATAAWPKRYLIEMDAPYFRRRIRWSRALHDESGAAAGVVLPDGSVRRFALLERVCWDVQRETFCTHADARIRISVAEIDVSDTGERVLVSFLVSVSTMPDARLGTTRVGAGGSGYSHAYQHRYQRTDGVWKLAEANVIKIFD